MCVHYIILKFEITQLAKVVGSPKFNYQTSEVSLLSLLANYCLAAAAIAEVCNTFYNVHAGTMQSIIFSQKAIRMKNSTACMSVLLEYTHMLY